MEIYLTAILTLAIVLFLQARRAKQVKASTQDRR